MHRSHWFMLLTGLVACTPAHSLCSFEGQFEGPWAGIGPVDGSCIEVHADTIELTARTRDEPLYSYGAGFVVPADFQFVLGEGHDDLAVTAVFDEVDSSHDYVRWAWTGDCVAQIDPITRRQDRHSPTWEANQRRIAGTMTCRRLDPVPDSAATESLRLVGEASFRLVATQYR